MKPSNFIKSKLWGSQISRFFVSCLSLFIVVQTIYGQTFDASTITIEPGAMHGGTAQVMPSGEIRYQLPIQLPPAGKGGLSYPLTLNYSSNASGFEGSLLGAGFSINVPPPIARCGQSVLVDGKQQAIQWSAEDRVCVNGQPLIPISGKWWEDGSRYKTQINDKNVYVYKSYAKWEVELEDGTSWEYDAIAGGHSYFWYQLFYPMMWLPVTLKSDYQGTLELDYTITNDWSTMNRSSVATTIDTTQAQNMARSYLLESIKHKSPDSKTRWTAEFCYEDRPDPDVVFASGVPIAHNKRLKEVRTFIGGGIGCTNSPASSDDAIFTYAMEYQNTTNNPDQFTRLSKVYQCNADQTACYTPTEFVWGNQAERVATDMQITLPNWGKVNSIVPLKLQGGRYQDFALLMEKEVVLWVTNANQTTWDSSMGQHTFKTTNTPTFVTENKIRIYFYRGQADGSFLGPIEPTVPNLTTAYGPYLQNLSFISQGDGTIKLWLQLLNVGFATVTCEDKTVSNGVYDCTNDGVMNLDTTPTNTLPLELASATTVYKKTDKLDYDYVSETQIPFAISTAIIENIDVSSGSPTSDSFGISSYSNLVDNYHIIWTDLDGDGKTDMVRNSINKCDLSAQRQSNSSMAVDTWTTVTLATPPIGDYDVSVVQFYPVGYQLLCRSLDGGTSFLIGYEDNTLKALRSYYKDDEVIHSVDQNSLDQCAGDVKLGGKCLASTLGTADMLVQDIGMVAAMMLDGPAGLAANVLLLAVDVFTTIYSYEHPEVITNVYLDTYASTSYNRDQMADYNFIKDIHKDTYRAIPWWSSIFPVDHEAHEEETILACYSVMGTGNGKNWVQVPALGSTNQYCTTSIIEDDLFQVAVDINGNGLLDYIFDSGGTFLVAEDYNPWTNTFVHKGQLESYLNNMDLSNITSAIFDFNGDGVQEMLFSNGQIASLYSPSGVNATVSFPRYVTQIKESNGQTWDIEYKMILEPGDHYQTDRSSSDPADPLVNVPVVTQLTSTTDRHTYVTTYQWENVIIDPDYGFQGFERMATQDKTMGLAEVREVYGKYPGWQFPKYSHKCLLENYTSMDTCTQKFESRMKTFYKTTFSGLPSGVDWMLPYLHITYKGDGTGGFTDYSYSYIENDNYGRHQHTFQWEYNLLQRKDTFSSHCNGYANASVDYTNPSWPRDLLVAASKVTSAYSCSSNLASSSEFTTFDSHTISLQKFTYADDGFYISQTDSWDSETRDWVTTGKTTSFILSSVVGETPSIDGFVYEQPFNKPGVKVIEILGPEGFVFMRSYSHDYNDSSGDYYSQTAITDPKFGAPISITAPSGAIQEIILDDFGRPTAHTQQSDPNDASTKVTLKETTVEEALDNGGGRYLVKTKILMNWATYTYAENPDNGVPWDPGSADPGDILEGGLWGDGFTPGEESTQLSGNTYSTVMEIHDNEGLVEKKIYSDGNWQSLESTFKASTVSYDATHGSQVTSYLPYKAGSPTSWVSAEYDRYPRLKKATSATGVSEAYSYSPNQITAVLPAYDNPGKANTFYLNGSQGLSVHTINDQSVANYGLNQVAYALIATPAMKEATQGFRVENVTMCPETSDSCIDVKKSFDLVGRVNGETVNTSDVITSQTLDSFSKVSTADHTQLGQTTLSHDTSLQNTRIDTKQLPTHASFVQRKEGGFTKQETFIDASGQTSQTIDHYYNAPTEDCPAGGNEAGLLVEKTIRLEDDTYLRNCYTHNPLGQVESIQIGSDRAPYQGNAYTFGYEYTPTKAVETIDLPDGRSVKYLFDSLGRLIRVTLKAGTTETVLASTSDFNIYGKPIAVAYQNGTSESIHYDKYGRFQSKTISSNDGDRTETLTYDSNDNVHTRAYKLQKGLTSRQYTMEYGYDALNRLVSYGNYESSTPDTISYSSLNLPTLVSLQEMNGLLTNVSASLEKNFHYDDWERFIGAELHDTSGAFYGSTRLNYIGKNLHSIEKYDANNNLMKTTYQIHPGLEVHVESNGTMNYSIFVSGWGRTIYREDRTGDGRTLGTYVDSWFYHYDSRENVVQTTDSSGALRSDVTYTPYGKIYPSLVFLDSELPDLGFLGKPYLSDFGLVLTEQRVYDVDAAQFVASDPLGLGVLREYGRNNPNRYIDPSGAFWEELGTGVRRGTRAIGTLAMSFVNKLPEWTIKFGIPFLAGYATDKATDGDVAAVIVAAQISGVFSGVLLKGWQAAVVKEWGFAKYFSAFAIDAARSESTFLKLVTSDMGNAVLAGSSNAFVNSMIVLLSGKSHFDDSNIMYTIGVGIGARVVLEWAIASKALFSLGEGAYLTEDAFQTFSWAGMADNLNTTLISLMANGWGVMFAKNKGGKWPAVIVDGVGSVILEYGFQKAASSGGLYKGAQADLAESVRLMVEGGDIDLAKHYLNRARFKQFAGTVVTGSGFMINTFQIYTMEQ